VQASLYPAQSLYWHYKSQGDSRRASLLKLRPRKIKFRHQTTCTQRGTALARKEATHVTWTGSFQIFCTFQSHDKSIYSRYLVPNTGRTTTFNYKLFFQMDKWQKINQSNAVKLFIYLFFCFLPCNAASNLRSALKVEAVCSSRNVGIYLQVYTSLLSRKSTPT
jgi:hypothetical protein